jgi:uncharacterized protein (TIGR02679 family)
VLEAAMDAGSRATMVCVSGNPTLVATRLLERLAADGAFLRLRYRGDFDWPGISIANRVIERFGAIPWRMGAADYEAALLAAGNGLVDLPERCSPRWEPGNAERFSVLSHGDGAVILRPRTARTGGRADPNSYPALGTSMSALTFDS